jgi:hypothetical protein
VDQRSEPADMQHDWSHAMGVLQSENMTDEQ